MVKTLGYYIDETQYRASRFMTKVGGKLVNLSVKGALGGGAATVATKLSVPFREALGWGATDALGRTAAVTTGEVLASAGGGLLTVGLGTGVNAYLNQREYRAHERRLTELYRPQVASLLDKPRKEVGVADIYTVAQDNPTLEEELTRYRKMRNLKNVAAVAGTVLAFGAVFAAIALVPAVAAMAGAAATAGLFSSAGLGFAAVVGVIGLGTLHISRKTVKGIGKQLFGMKEPTVEDRIEELSKERRKEKHVTAGKVFEVYVAAQPELAAEIEEHFGKPYAKLKAEEKIAAVEHFGPQVNLAEVVADINEERMNVRELTFKVHGQDSGVYPKAPIRDRLKDFAQDKAQDVSERLDPLQDKLADAGHSAADKMRGAAERFQDWREERRQSKLQDKVAEALEEGREIPKEALEQAPESSWRNRIALERQQQAAQGESQGRG